MIENELNEVTLIFHSDKAEDKKMRAFVETISTHKLKTFDLKNDTLTQTQLAQIADKMQISIVDLVDDAYLDSIPDEMADSVKVTNKTGILDLIVHNPLLLATPILIVGHNAYSYGSAFEILKEKFSLDGVESIASANVEENRSVL